jgi:hypothetical protein
VRSQEHRAGAKGRQSEPSRTQIPPVVPLLPAVAEEAVDAAISEAIAKAKGFMSLNAYAESMCHEALEGLWLESGT